MSDGMSNKLKTNMRGTDDLDKNLQKNSENKFNWEGLNHNTDFLWVWSHT